MVEKPASWNVAWDPTNVTRWKHKVGFHNRGIRWDTPMARWGGEGNDWIMLLAQRQPRKEDVIHSLLASMRQTVEKKTKANETRPAKKPRESRPLELGIPEGKELTLEIKGDCKNDCGLRQWPCQVENEGLYCQNLLREWRGRGVAVRQRIANWATLFFREHNKEADLWAAKGVKGREDEWVDTARVVRSDVTGLCGFWDGSCDNGKCGGGYYDPSLHLNLLIASLFTKNAGQRWVTIPWMLNWAAVVCCWKNCVPGSIKACVNNKQCSCAVDMFPLLLNCIFGGIISTRLDRYRAPPPRLLDGGWHVARVCVAARIGNLWQ